MSCGWNNNVAGTGNCITAEEFCRRRCCGGSTSPCSGCGGNTSPGSGSRCNFVYECLIDLLEDALEDNNNQCCCRR